MRASEVISRCAPEGVVARFADDDAGEGVLEDARGARLRIAARVATTAETRRRCEIARALGVEIANASGDVNAFCDAVRSALERAFAAMSARRGASASAFRSSHPNVAPACAVIVGDGVVCSVEPFYEYTLGACLRSGGNPFANDAAKASLAAFQLCRALAHAHEKNLAHGNLSVDCVCLSTLSGDAVGVPFVQLSGMHNSPHARDGEVGPCREIEVMAASLKQRQTVETSARHLTSAWRVGAISNLEYIAKLNELARRGKDRAYYAVAPWVIDFKEFPFDASTDSLRGARDLSKTKWRLTKGDEQLDFTYRNTTPPHHVSDDCLSELGACIALARRTPRSTLARVVRANFVADEYPKDIARLFEMSPDEAPIDFYLNPNVFTSIHEDMRDLSLPSWSQVGEGSADYFIKIHREALESKAVSDNLHAWIDLTFGYATYGRAAFIAKNVMVRDDEKSKLKSSGRFCIFHAPHPKRSAGEIPRAVPAVNTEDDLCDAVETIIKITEPSLRNVQEKDLRALGRVLGAIYAGAPCPAHSDDTPSSVSGLFNKSPMKSISDGLFDDIDRTQVLFKSLKYWLNRMPVEARDVVKLLMDSPKPIAASAVRDSVLFSTDIRSAAMVLGNLRTAHESRAARIMIADDALKGVSPTVAHLVLGDICPEVESYVGGKPLAAKDEMEVAMCLSSLVVTACGVASRRDIIDMIVPLVLRAVSAPSACLNAEGPTLKRELFDMAVLRALRKATGAATFNRIFIPVLIACLQPKFCSAEEVARVTCGLTFIAKSSPLPVALRRIVDVLRKALKSNRDDTSSGAHVLVADILASLAKSLGPQSEAFIFKASTASAPSVLDHLDEWHQRSSNDRNNAGAWGWLPRDVSDHEEDDETETITMSSVLANAGAVDDDPWRLHVAALTSWRVHSRIARPSAQTLSVSADERLFLTNGVTSRGDNVVRVWRTSGPEGENSSGAMSAYTGHEATVRASMFLDFVNDHEGDVSRACSCDDKGYMHVWNTNSDHIWQFYSRDAGGFESMCVYDGARGSPYVAGGTTNGGVLIADAGAGKIFRQFKCPNDDAASATEVEALHASTDGLVYASNRLGYMCGFDLRTSGAVFDVKAHDGGVNKIVSPSSKSYEILTASDDMTVALWDVRMIDTRGDAKKRFDGRVRTFRGHQHEVRDIAVSTKGDVFSVSGATIGVFALTSSGNEKVARFSPLSVYGEQTPFCAIQLLSSSRLFATLRCDGVLSVCR
jgi:hypothetical protein